MQANSIWNYISQLRPALRGHVHIYPQVYREERWYILHDQSSEQYLRFNDTAYSVLGRLDGDLTLEEIYDFISESSLDHPITKEEIGSLIGQLNAAELLKDALPVNAQDVFKQYANQKHQKKQRLIMNPLSIKIPLFNPDKRLNTLIGFAKVVFSKLSLWFFGMTLFLALLLGISNFELLLDAISMMELSPMQLLALWITYPFIKFFHELGHGLAIKSFGGEVREVGINLLLFMPVPYVDATASWGFRSKYRRMLVGAAGIFVELLIAAFALFLYLSIEAGFLQQMALNIIIIATLSTLFFNGNPLLRFDGYFILEDWLEIPNLATRSKNYYYYLTQRYLLKIEEARNPLTAKGEEKWFLLYGFAAPTYRLFILFGITLYLVDSFLTLGIGLALWVFMMQVVVPLFKASIFLTTSQATLTHRKRGIGLIVGIVLLIAGVLSIPVPTVTYLDGVILTSKSGQVIAKTSGFVLNSDIDSNGFVDENQLIFELEDRELDARKAALKARLNELKIELITAQRKSRVRAEMIKKDIEATQKEFELVAEDISRLKIYAPSYGKFVYKDFREIKGRYIRKGELLGYIVNSNDLVVKAAIEQSRIGLLETYETKAEFRLAQNPDIVYKSEITRQTPQATLDIPSPTLGVMGGGYLAIQAGDRTGTKLIKEVFLIDLSIPENLKLETIGGRAYVLLNHGNLSIASQMYLYVNQLFLRRFYDK